jgi:hypothetical protein
MGLVFLMIGTVGTLIAVGTLATQFGVAGGPALRMSIGACATSGTGKSTDILCDGSAAPGGGPPGEWILDHSDRSYDFGNVVTVRCDPFGQCTQIDARAKGRGFFGLGFGLSVVSGVLFAAFFLAADRFRPGWRVLLRRGWLRWTLLGWFGALLIVTFGGIVMLSTF